MTLPNERVWAVQNTRQFLYDLMDPKKTPRVSRAVRLMARRCLKHYPQDMHLNDIFNEHHESKHAWCDHEWANGGNQKTSYCVKCGKD